MMNYLQAEQRIPGFAGFVSGMKQDMSDLGSVVSQNTQDPEAADQPNNDNNSNDPYQNIQIQPPANWPHQS